jgi:hypothetical protein
MDSDFILESIRNVGPNKPVGYLPRSTVYNVLNLNIKDIKKIVHNNNNIKIFYQKSTWIKSGAIFVYNKPAVRLTIGKYIENFIGSDIEVEDIIDIVAFKYFDKQTLFYKIIRELFGE